jgi:hypothetical protein
MFRIFRSLLWSGILAALGSGAAYAADCSVSLTNNIGDEIAVSALLHSTYTGEIGEGETLGVTSSGGELSQTLSSYELWFPFKPFKATQANETIQGTIAGSDGDETCAFSASTAPAAFSNAQRAELEAVNESIRRISLIYATALYLCDVGRANPTLCAEHFKGSSLIMDLIAYLAGVDAAVSKSGAFKEVFQPPAILDVEAANPPDALGDALFALKGNSKKILSLELAIATTAARAKSAYSSRASYWQRVQLNTLKRYKKELGQAMLDQASLSQNLSQAIADASADVSIQAADVQAAQGRLKDGLTQKQVAHLERLGCPPGDVPFVAAAFLMQDPNSFSGTLAGFLADPTYLQSLQMLGQDLVG